ncbi:hypothetical protein CEXT_540441 [Caerostris extrusa]|uniref:Uncharacterized protein n=1 Tax=Caerostris extrusa TaxID=172846 RepID=A0AAV4VN86_CAEEX|nr:hypothetical protein CEXT_540441 [Caerostris extrusa]
MSFERPEKQNYFAQPAVQRPVWRVRHPIVVIKQLKTRGSGVQRLPGKEGGQFRFHFATKPSTDHPPAPYKCLYFF